MEFNIVAENTGDETEDKIKLVDSLPGEMLKVDGNFTEEWDDFASKEERSFILKARLDPAEFETGDSFEKCVVNKVELDRGDDFQSSDTAIVCYNKADIKELPDTGPVAPVFLGLGGVVFAIAGSILKRMEN